jgi:hypothetical protein
VKAVKMLEKIHDKRLSKVGVEESFLNMMNGIYKEFIDNIILNI